MSITVTASIVLFEESLLDLHKTIESFLKIPFKKKLFLIDNTSTRFFEYLFNDKNIIYIAIEENIGFGAGHNKIINDSLKESTYHIILNPDVFFEESVIGKLIEQFNEDEDLAMIAPKVLFPNGKYQYSCRRYPNVIELFARRFNILKIFFNKSIQKGQYIDKDLTKPFYTEYLTGCFHLYRTQDLIKVGGFDERYFLYMEDVDICRKIDQIGKKKLYFPKVEIVHVLKQGSSKDFLLFFKHISSAIKYFLKWGF